MKRILACFMAVVLVVGLMPMPSYAAERLQTQSALEAAGPASLTAGASAVSAAFSDSNLYDALVSQLTDQGVAHEADSDAKTVTMEPGEAAKVVRLNLSYSSISDLTGIGALAAFPNMTELDLSHNALSGSAASPLADLTQLTYLDLYENKLDDWTFLAKLTKLEHLNLGLNKRGGSTRESLKKLERLKWLDFSFPDNNEPNGYNYIIDCISGLVDLEHVDLCGWFVNDLNGTGAVPGGVGNLVKLKTLILNYNYVKDLTPLLACAELEELHVAHNRMYYSSDNGAGNLLAEDGSLKLSKLRKLDMWAQESPTGKSNWLEDPTKNARKHVNALYQLHKQGKLELGYDYRWIDELAAMKPHRDSSGAEYIAYEDFGAYCREGSDDFDAMRNAHQYADDHGCEVRSVVGEGPEAAKGKAYHVYRLYDKDDYATYSSVDWQGATIFIHDEDIDWHFRANKSLFIMRPSPAGFATSDRRPSANTRTLEAGATLTLDAAALPLARTITSIKGLSPEVDAAIAEMNTLGYSRYYVQLYDANTLRYARGSTYKYKGQPQWDALIVDGAGTVQRFNAAKLSGDGTPEGSYIPPDPEPLQWQFDNVTKVVVTPIAGARAHVKNARFVTMPLASKTELPRERWGDSYLRNFEISGTNLELSNITQTVGTAEVGYDNDDYSGLYVGFLDLKDCAELDVHDVYTWQRRCTRSTYGFQTMRVMCAHIKDVGDSNPVWRGGHGNHGGNYAKHMLWENITLGRIDQHTGCYDMAVRDSSLHSLSLTGAGPLTIERTEVASGCFLNLRADYGSTWDGVANIIDCTHYPTLGPTQEPDNLVASTPDIGWDFGYAPRFPELHVKNFAIDASRYERRGGTRYRVAYGIASNYLNGLNMLEDYWPDTIEVDGLDIRNWNETFGYEPHVLMPLYMTGKPAECMRSGAWKIENLTYNGEPFTPVAPSAFEEGDELAGPGVVADGIDGVRDKQFIAKSLTPEEIELLEVGLEKSDIVVAYTGDEPRVLLRAAGRFADSDDSWTSAFPYFVEHRADMEVAYYSGREFLAQWRAIKEKHPDAGSFNRIHIYGEHLEGKNGESQDGVANVLHVRMAQTHVVCQHVWGEPDYTWSADNRSCTARRVCALDESHVQEETASAAAEVTRAATCERKGETTYTVQFAKSCFASQVRTVEDIAAAGHSWGVWKKASASQHQRVCKHDQSHVQEAAHRWNGGVVTKKASAYNQGTLTNTCVDCGAQKSTSIAATVSRGASYRVSGSTYKVTSNTFKKRTVTLVKTKAVKAGKGFTVPAAVKIEGAAYQVNAIGSKAFNGSKASKITVGANVTAIGAQSFSGANAAKTIVLGKGVTKVAAKAFKANKKLRTLVVKTKRLKASTIKNGLKGSKVTVVKVQVGTKGQNNRYVSKYNKVFTKFNCGKKVTVIT